MEYQIIHIDKIKVVQRTEKNGSVWFIPFDESNVDYQQCLIDTDGGLPIPEAEEQN